MWRKNGAPQDPNPGSKVVGLCRKAYVSDLADPRLMPTVLAAARIGAVTDREVSPALLALTGRGRPSGRGDAVPLDLPRHLDPGKGQVTRTSPSMSQTAARVL